MMMVIGQVHLPSLGLALSVWKGVQEDRLMVRVLIWLGDEVEGKIDVQGYGEA